MGHPSHAISTEPERGVTRCKGGGLAYLSKVGNLSPDFFPSSKDAV